MTVLRWFVLLLAFLPSLVAPAASAQDVDDTPIPSPEATIAALQTRVAELEALLAPSATPESAAEAGIDESGKLFGPGVALLPPGEAGKVSVVLVGPYGTWLPVIIRNNTDESLGRVDVSASARAADGSLIGAGTSLDIQPAIIEPGGYGIGNVSFSFLELPADTTFEFKVEGEPGSEPYLLYDLSIASATFQGDRIVGEVRNDTGLPITTNAQVIFACLDPDGALVNVDMVYSAEASIDPDGTAIFQIDEYHEPCELFLLTATGFSNP